MRAKLASFQAEIASRLGVLRWSEFSFRARVLTLTGALFLTLVALRVHGSSIALAAQTWAPDTAMRHFVATPLLDSMEPETAKRWRERLLAEPRYIRMDEWSHQTPWSFSQFTHVPKFPVVNRNIGQGQNMLTQPWVPVAHVTAIARPMSWGYLLLGAQRGLAWAWWYQLFGCFVAAYLLFELIVPARPGLALLGAGWFCGSAYVIFWSHWPAYVVGVGLAAVLAGYWLLKSSRPAVILTCGVIAGVAVSGFVMQLYPPWQVPLAQAFIAVFAGLAWRDRLWRHWSEHRGARVGALCLFAVSTLLLLGSFAVASWDALLALTQTEYPGLRRVNGGDCPAWKLFGGIYNAFTADYFAPGVNPSEAAGFFLTFPAVAAALIVSPRLRSRAGPVVWALLPLLALWTYFCIATVPPWFAKITLLERVTGFRCQIAIGLASIIVSVRLLAAAEPRANDRESWTTALVAFAVAVGLYTWKARELLEHWPVLGPDSGAVWIWAVPLAAAAACALLALGRAKAFAALLGPALLVTSGSFNPLSIGFPDWRQSELATAIGDVTARDERGDRSLWLTYGGPSYPINGLLVQLMGARAFAGVYGYPQLELWKALDPAGAHVQTYNRFTHVRLLPPARGARDGIEYRLANIIALRVFISPFHPALRKLGARYVLTFGKQHGVSTSGMTLRHASKHLDFAIWELPPPALASAAPD